MLDHRLISYIKKLRHVSLKTTIISGSFEYVKLRSDSAQLFLLDNRIYMSADPSGGAV
jgi:hypothetical protein